MDFKKKSKVNKQLLWVGLGSVIMFFGGLTSAYIVRKAEGNWEEFSVPYWFEYSTGIIILSSLLLFVVRHKIKKDQNISYLLFSTLFLGILFTFCQFKGWEKIINNPENGTASLVIDGGIGETKVNWYGANPSLLDTGIYPYSITDTRGAIYTDSVIITNPPSLLVNTYTTRIIDSIKNKRHVYATTTLTKEGGSGSLIVNWFGANPDSLPVGIHPYSVIDVNDSSFSVNGYVRVTEYPEIMVNELTTQTKSIHFTGPGSNPSGSFFYTLTVTHLAHLIGGLIALLVTLINSIRNKYSSNNFLGIELSSIYWHFLGILWVYLFLFIKFDIQIASLVTLAIIVGMIFLSNLFKKKP